MKNSENSEQSVCARVHVKNVYLREVFENHFSMSLETYSEPCWPLRWNFLQNQIAAESRQFFRKTLHLRCVTEFWIHLWIVLETPYLFWILRNTKEKNCACINKWLWNNQLSLICVDTFYPSIILLLRLKKSQIWMNDNEDEIWA